MSVRYIDYAAFTFKAGVYKTSEKEYIERGMYIKRNILKEYIEQGMYIKRNILNQVYLLQQNCMNDIHSQPWEWASLLNHWS